MSVDNKPRDFVGLIGNDRLVEKHGKRQVGKRELRRDALLTSRRRDARELVTAA